MCIIYTKVPHVKGRITGTEKEHSQVCKHVALIKWSKNRLRNTKINCLELTVQIKVTITKKYNAAFTTEPGSKRLLKNELFCVEITLEGQKTPLCPA